MKKIILFSIFFCLLGIVSCNSWNRSRDSKASQEAIVGVWERKSTRAVEVITHDPATTAAITQDINERRPYNYSGVEGADIYLFREDGLGSTTLGGDIMHNGEYSVEGNKWQLELPIKTVTGEIDIKKGTLSVFHDETLYFQRIYPDAGIEKVITAGEYSRTE